MPHQTSKKKSAISAKALLSKQKQAKRARIDAQSDGDTASAQPTKSSRMTQVEKTRPSVSFTQPALDLSRKKSVQLAVPPEPTPSKSKKKMPSAVKPSSTAPASAPDGTTALPRAFMIIVGSYEKLLYGIEGTYEGSSTTGEGSSTSSMKPMLKAVFIFPAHAASVRAVAASPSGGKWLATGSSDEVIKVWDLRRRKEVGGLMQHQGSITHLSFASRFHLVSASEDGTITLFHTRDWTVLAVLKGHKGRINSVAVHPTGKLALSVGKDRALRMWDLMRGKPSASTLLGKEGELVKWSGDGSQFIVQSGNVIDIYQADMTAIQSISHPSRIHDVRFIRHPSTKGDQDAHDLLFVAAEDKRISVYARSQRDEVEAEDNERDDSAQKSEYAIVAELVGHTARVKAIDSLEIALPSPDSDATESSTTILASASSDGMVHAYDLASLPRPPILANSRASGTIPVPCALDPIAVYNTKGTRLTCLALAASQISLPNTGKVAGAKRRRRDEDEDEDACSSTGPGEELDDDEEDNRTQPPA